MNSNPYRKGMLPGWRFCLLLSLFACIPRLIFVWEREFSAAVLEEGLRNIIPQFLITYGFSWIYLYICLTYLSETDNWFNRQRGSIQLILLILIFLNLNELLFLSERFLSNKPADPVLFRIVYYFYHFLVVMAIYGFGLFAVATENNYKINLENEQLKREQLKTQLEALRNQLNPHFLFNALNILNISISTKPEMAQQIVHDLSDILRYNLKIQNQNLVLLNDELAAAKSYLDLYKVRFGDKLVFYFVDIQTSKEWYIIPLSLQLLIENAIKHNVITSNQVLIIEVKLHEAEKQLVVVNSVNRKLQPAGTGIGLQNLDKRYKIQTGKKPSLQNDEQQFTVKVPLIESP